MISDYTRFSELPKATAVSSSSVLCLSELMQTEMHHIRTLRIMSEVYSKGLQKELQVGLQTVEKLFPALDELLDLHTQHLLRLLERKRESQLEGGYLDGGIIISRIGDLLVNQVRDFQDVHDPEMLIQEKKIFFSIKNVMCFLFHGLFMYCVWLLNSIE